MIHTLLMILSNVWIPTVLRALTVTNGSESDPNGRTTTLKEGQYKQKETQEDIKMYINCEGLNY